MPQLSFAGCNATSNYKDKSLVAGPAPVMDMSTAFVFYVFKPRASFGQLLRSYVENKGSHTDKRAQNQGSSLDSLQRGSLGKGWAHAPYGSHTSISHMSLGTSLLPGRVERLKVRCCAYNLEKFSKIQNRIRARGACYMDQMAVFLCHAIRLLLE